MRYPAFMTLSKGRFITSIVTCSYIHNISLGRVDTIQDLIKTFFPCTIPSNQETSVNAKGRTITTSVPRENFLGLHEASKRVCGTSINGGWSWHVRSRKRMGAIISFLTHHDDRLRKDEYNLSCILIIPQSGKL
jgi:hypothetical protein